MIFGSTGLSNSSTSTISKANPT